MTPATGGANGHGNKLASFNYDRSGTSESVDLTTSGGVVRYYYVSNGHGDVVALTDSVGTVVASYSYDAFGNLTESLESLPNGWSNPYRYDGAEGVRYDSETGLYWLSVRAYDPTLGRFLSHDPLGRLAAQGLDFQPYVYANNNPVNKTDPSGMFSARPILVDGGTPVGPTQPAPTGMNPTKPSPPRCWIPEVCNHGNRNNSSANAKKPLIVHNDDDGEWNSLSSSTLTPNQQKAVNILGNAGANLLIEGLLLGAASVAFWEISQDLFAKAAVFAAAAVFMISISWLTAGASMAPVPELLAQAAEYLVLGTFAKLIAQNLAIAAAQSLSIAVVLFGLAVQKQGLTVGMLEFAKTAINVLGIGVGVAANYINFSAGGVIGFFQRLIGPVLGYFSAVNSAMGAIQDAENCLQGNASCPS